MRIVTARLWNSGEAKQTHLIAAHDLDLNDQETRAEIGQINNTLDNAIAHDIASDGTAIAEIMDANLGSRDATDACKHIVDYLAKLDTVAGMDHWRTDAGAARLLAGAVRNDHI
jgi:hypothetical protein